MTWFILGAQCNNQKMRGWEKVSGQLHQERRRKNRIQRLSLKSLIYTKWSTKGEPLQ